MCLTYLSLKAQRQTVNVLCHALQENAVQGAVHVDATSGNSLFMGEKQAGKEPGHNNYGRPEGQNVGNFLTDRNSSRVLAPPGEASEDLYRLSCDQSGRTGLYTLCSSAHDLWLPSSKSAPHRQGAHLGEPCLEPTNLACT